MKIKEIDDTILKIENKNHEDGYVYQTLIEIQKLLSKMTCKSCKYMNFKWFVGIDICEDKYLNKGMGTEALELWIQYLFSNSNIHRLSLDTWSFNKRMMHVAEKAGFIFEGKQREFIKWKEEWIDAVHYGMLRREWEDKNID